MSRRKSRRGAAAIALRPPQPRGDLPMCGDLRGDLRGDHSQTSAATAATFSLKRDINIIYIVIGDTYSRTRTLITRVEPPQPPRGVIS
jgi:hypothetical protein